MGLITSRVQFDNLFNGLQKKVGGMVNQIIRMALFAGICLISLATTASSSDFSGKKILWVNSYHKGYAWSDGIGRGIQSVFADTGIQLDIYDMDTKRNGDLSFKLKQGEIVKDLIEESRPDLVIVSDDNATKYVMQHHFPESNLPFVFCGINNHPKTYDLPKQHVTGMREMDLLPQLLEQLAVYSKGGKVGQLGFKVEERQRTADVWKREQGVVFDKRYHVKTFSEWKSAFLKAQNEMDMLFVSNHNGIEGWNEKEAIEFVLNHQTIPTGATEAWVMDHVFLGYVKIPEEQGRWAAQTAMRILEGEPPSDIPIARNKEGLLLLNVGLVKKLNLTISKAIYKRAKIIE